MQTKWGHRSKGCALFIHVYVFMCQGKCSTQLKSLILERYNTLSLKATAEPPAPSSVRLEFLLRCIIPFTYRRSSVRHTYCRWMDGCSVEPSAQDRRSPRPALHALPLRSVQWASPSRAPRKPRPCWGTDAAAAPLDPAENERQGPQCRGGGQGREGN